MIIEIKMDIKEIVRTEVEKFLKEKLYNMGVVVPDIIVRGHHSDSELFIELHSPVVNDTVAILEINKKIALELRKPYLRDFLESWWEQLGETFEYDRFLDKIDPLIHSQEGVD